MSRVEVKPEEIKWIKSKVDEKHLPLTEGTYQATGNIIYNDTTEYACLRMLGNIGLIEREFEKDVPLIIYDEMLNLIHEGYVPFKLINRNGDSGTGYTYTLKLYIHITLFSDKHKHYDDIGTVYAINVKYKGKVAYFDQIYDGCNQMLAEAKRTKTIGYKKPITCENIPEELSRAVLSY